jgi:tetratricopeptide (TPR) repeat protein
MKRLLTLAFFVLLPMAAFAQFPPLPSGGGGLAGTGIQGPNLHGSGGGGNGGGGNSRERDDDNEKKAASRPRKTAEEKQRERDYKEFANIYNKHEHSRRTRDEWLAFAKRTGWPSAWYNFGVTAWKLDELDAADAAFNYAIQHGDYSLIEDAKTNRIGVLEEEGFTAEKTGDWDMARVHFFQAQAIRTWDTHPTYLATVSYYLQANTEAEYRVAFEKIKEFAAPQYNDDKERPATVRLYHLCWEQLQYYHATDIIRSYNNVRDTSVLPRAEDYLRKAVQFDEETGSPMYGARAVLASVLEVEGKDDEAQDECLKVLKQHPNDETANFVLNAIAKKRTPQHDIVPPVPH